MRTQEKRKCREKRKANALFQRIERQSLDREDYSFFKRASSGAASAPFLYASKTRPRPPFVPSYGTTRKVNLTPARAVAIATAASNWSPSFAAAARIASASVPCGVRTPLDDRTGRTNRPIGTVVNDAPLTSRAAYVPCFPVVSFFHSGASTPITVKTSPSSPENPALSQVRRRPFSVSAEAVVLTSSVAGLLVLPRPLPFAICVQVLTVLRNITHRYLQVYILIRYIFICYSPPDQVQFYFQHSVSKFNLLALFNIYPCNYRNLLSLFNIKNLRTS